LVDFKCCTICHVGFVSRSTTTSNELVNNKKTPIFNFKI
jgi:hypothetical protein